MLHDLTFFSEAHILNCLESLLDKPMEIEDIVEPMEEGEEDDENKTISLLPLHTPSRHSMQSTPSVSVHTALSVRRKRVCS